MNDFWRNFIKHYAANHECMVEFDEEWPSPCLAGLTPGQQDLWVKWQPVSRATDPTASLHELGVALEITIPETLKHFFCDFYADHLAVKFDGRALTLLQVWNEDDFKRLQENIIGHVLMKRRLKQPDTIFIGVTDDDEELISVIPNTGEVVFEFVGRIPHQIVANSLNEFVDQLTVA